MSSSSLEKFLMGTLLGALVGGLLGVLLAPTSGEETRRKLKTGALDFKNQAGDKVHDSIHDLEESVEDLKHRATDTLNQSLEHIKDAGLVLKERASVLSKELQLAGQEALGALKGENKGDSKHKA